MKVNNRQDVAIVSIGRYTMKKSREVISIKFMVAVTYGRRECGGHDWEGA